MCIRDSVDVGEVVRQAQTTQAAQAGYAADYQNKRLPVAVNEVKEWQKGRKRLEEDLQDKKTGYTMGRVSKRLATDCSVRGVCRGSVECANLVDNCQSQDPTHAESIRTAPTVELTLDYAQKLLQAAFNQEDLPLERSRMQADPRLRGGYSPGAGRLIACPKITLYGERGRHEQIHQLSLYEFTRRYTIDIARHPYSAEKEEESPHSWHARLTQIGRDLLDRNCFANRPKLRPGIHYQIKEEGGQEWLPLGHGERAQSYRHDWIVVPRKRPHNPILYGAQGSHTDEEQAQKVLMTFFPWTTHREDVSDSVPYIGDLRLPEDISWRQALVNRLQRHGFPTEESRRYLHNFCFVYCLPRELQSDADLHINSDNEDMEDPLLQALAY